MTKRSPILFLYASSEIIRPAVMIYVRFPLAFRHLYDLLHERGIELSHETVRFSRTRCSSPSAAEN